MGDELCLPKLVSDVSSPAAPSPTESRRRSDLATAGGSSSPSGRTLNDPEFKRRLQELRKVDNHTNFFYIAGVWAIIAAAAAGAIATHQYVVAQGLSWLWSVPAFFAAIVVIGASQHQLAGATHEATHHILFKSRWLNEVVSDWLCMFPLFSTTYTFRLHHLAHHQYINSEWDPDRAQLTASGHWLDFPIASADFLKFLGRQLWLPNLLRYMRVRIQHNSFRTESNAYAKGAKKVAGVPARIGTLCTLSTLGFCWWAVAYDQRFWLAVVPPVALAVTLAVLSVLPSNFWAEMRLKPVFSPRATGMMRLVFIIATFWAVSWAQVLTGAPAWGYFLALWIAPALTTFGLFMILRQLVQHGNGDRGWLTNSRVFFVNPFIRYAVFPFGMDYHLPHHMYATVPHYNLPKLHELLLEYPEYAEEAVVVEGYFAPHRADQTNPTVVQVLGPEWAPKRKHEAFVDHSVLDAWEVDEREKLTTVPPDVRRADSGPPDAGRG